MLSDEKYYHRVRKLREVFARFGIPKIIVSDNGTQFTSCVLEQFLTANGIHHKIGAPYHPATTGAAENIVKTIKTAITKAKYKNPSHDMHYILNRFLYFY